MVPGLAEQHAVASFLLPFAGCLVSAVDHLNSSGHVSLSVLLSKAPGPLWCVLRSMQHTGREREREPSSLASWMIVVRLWWPCRASTTLAHTTCAGCYSPTSQSKRNTVLTPGRALGRSQTAPLPAGSTAGAPQRPDPGKSSTASNAAPRSAIKRHPSLCKGGPMVLLPAQPPLASGQQIDEET